MKLAIINLGFIKTPTVEISFDDVISDFDNIFKNPQTKKSDIIKLLKNTSQVLCILKLERIWIKIMYNFFKRLLDIFVSLTHYFYYLFLPIIIILRFSAEGEVFYYQERIGIHNSKFQIWKFATMLKNSMNIGTGSITLKNDPRVTKFGFFLRKTKINELPQIINIKR